MGLGRCLGRCRSSVFNDGTGIALRIAALRIGVSRFRDLPLTLRLTSRADGSMKEGPRCVYFYSLVKELHVHAKLGPDREEPRI